MRARFMLNVDKVQTLTFFFQLTDSFGNQTDRCRLKCSFTHRYKYRRGHVRFYKLKAAQMFMVAGGSFYAR